MASGCQTSNHQEPFNCPFTAVMARRKLSASSIVSCTSARPAGCSIMAAATSHDAMMPYWGEVDVCIMNASLKRAMSSCLRLGVLDVDHRGLRQRGQKLVGGLRGEGDGVLRARRLRRRDGVIAVIELVEIRVGVPGLVEVQHLDRVAERSA